MATFKVDGIDDLMIQIDRAGSGMRPRIDDALTRSAEVVHQAMIDEEMGSFKSPTGELGRFVQVGPVWHNSSDAAINVFIRGDSYVGVRGRARSAGMVAGLQQTKHNNPWIRRANTKSRKQVRAIIAEALGMEQ